MRNRFRNVAAALALIARRSPARTSAGRPGLALRPIDLRVFGGEYDWHADNDFRLDWNRPPVSEEGFPLAAVHYRVRDPAGAVAIGELQLPWYTTCIENIQRPPGPGAYTAEVWLEGPGTTGPVASGDAALRRRPAGHRRNRLRPVAGSRGTRPRS